MRKIVLSLLALGLGLSLGADSARAAAGSLDPIFGQGGIAQTSLSSLLFEDAALQTDGSIVIYFRENQGELVRFLSTGALDTSFGNAGIAPLPPGASGITQAIFTGSVALQSDGKILVSSLSPSNSSQYIVSRLNFNGTVDTSFGAGGEATVQLGTPLVGQALMVQTDGKILLGIGLENVVRAGPSRTGLARFNTNGSLDNTFGSGGTVITTGIGGCTALAELSDGEVLALNSGFIQQFTPTGSLESTVTGGPAAAKSANIFQSNGEYIFAGAVYVGAPRGRDLDTQVSRFNANGTLDTTFNSPIFDFVGEAGSGQFDVASSAALQANDQVVIVGSHSQSSSSAAVNALARLNTNGSLDSTFGNGGIVTNNLPAGTIGLHKVLIQSDGKILAVGTTSTAVLFVERYLAQ